MLFLDLLKRRVKKLLADVKSNKQEMKGVIKRVMASYPDGNSILALRGEDVPDYAKNKMYPEEFVAIGSFARVIENQCVALTGKWTNHARYGWRFMVDSYEEVVPTSKDAIVDYLASGLFKGIGYKTAQNIVDAFGEDTMKIIEEEPDRLEEVKGISSKKVASVVAAYYETKNIKELMLAFKPFHISNKKIIKVYKLYGKNTLKKIKENPYRLCEDVEGIGFATADRFAAACNIAIDNPFRIRAGIIYVLNENASQKGHVYLHVDDLQKQLDELLTRDGQRVYETSMAAVIADMISKKELVLDKEDIYLEVFYNSEKYAGQKVAKMLSTAPRKFTVDTDALIAELEKTQNIKYANNQKIAFLSMERNNVLIITGGPGTGKTTIIKGLINIFQRNFPGSTIALAAPTGRAAKKMEEATGYEAMTMHRLLEMKSIDDRMYCQRNEENPIEADMIILDESSMIDLRLFYLFIKAVQPTTKLVLVGDVDQLPSVGAGDVFRDLIESNKVPTVYLNEIFRQESTSKIIVNADRINKGLLGIELGEEFDFVAEDDPENIPDLVKQVYIEEMEKGYTPDDIQVLSPYRKKTSTGVDNLNKMLQEIINPKADDKEELVYGSKLYRIDDKVMQYRNDYEKMVFNGDTGRIKGIRKDAEGNQLITISMNGNEIEYERDELADIDLAYASTVHKSQGSEYKIVIIPVTTQHYMLLQRNLIYTAVTRAKEKVILIGQSNALVTAIKSVKIKERNSKLNERI